MGFGVWGFGLMVGGLGLGFRVWGLGRTWVEVVGDARASPVDWDDAHDNAVYQLLCHVCAFRI